KRLRISEDWSIIMNERLKIQYPCLCVRKVWRLIRVFRLWPPIGELRPCMKCVNTEKQLLISTDSYATRKLKVLPCTIMQTMLLPMRLIEILHFLQQQTILNVSWQVATPIKTLAMTRLPVWEILIFR